MFSAILAALAAIISLQCNFYELSIIKRSDIRQRADTVLLVGEKIGLLKKIEIAFRLFFDILIFGEKESREKPFVKEDYFSMARRYLQKLNEQHVSFLFCLILSALAAIISLHS